MLVHAKQPGGCQGWQALGLRLFLGIGMTGTLLVKALELRQPGWQWRANKMRACVGVLFLPELPLLAQHPVWQAFLPGLCTDFVLGTVLQVIGATSCGGTCTSSCALAIFEKRNVRSQILGLLMWYAFFGW